MATIEGYSGSIQDWIRGVDQVIQQAPPEWTDEDFFFQALHYLPPNFRRMVRYYPQLDPDFSQTWSCLKQNLLETYGKRDPDPPDESQEHSQSGDEYGKGYEQCDGDDSDHEEESYYDSEYSNHSENESDYEDDPDHSDRDQKGSDNSEYKTDYKEDPDQPNPNQSTYVDGLGNLPPATEFFCGIHQRLCTEENCYPRRSGNRIYSTYVEDGKVNDGRSFHNLESKNQPDLVQRTDNGRSFTYCGRHLKPCDDSCFFQQALLRLRLDPEADQEEWEDGLDNLPPAAEYFCIVHRELCTEEECHNLQFRNRLYDEPEAVYRCRQHDALCEIDCPYINEALNPRQETRSEPRWDCELHSRNCKATCPYIKLIIDDDELYDQEEWEDGLDNQ